MINAKKGRKAANWINPATNLPVDGLGRNADGRWRIIATGKTFVEIDTERAIQKFLRLTAQQVPVITAIGQTMEPRENFQGTQSTWTLNPSDFKTYLDLQMQKNDQPFWDRVIWELLNRKEYAAKKTGFEQLAYLTELKAPEAAQTIEGVLKLWEANAKCGKDAINKVKRAWEAFCSFTNIKAISDINPQLCVAYADNVHKTVASGKQQQHLFNGARRILTFTQKRAVAVRSCANALEAMKLMQPNKSTKNKNPKPIKIEDFVNLLHTSKGEDRAMVLCMLNLCMYAGEVVRCKWSDFDFVAGTFNSRRKKKGEFVRVATLWSETIEALQAVKNDTDFVFLASGGAAKGQALKKDGAFLRLRQLMTDAKLKGVTPSHLRDGAYGAAVDANVSEDLIRIFAGHSSGMADMYVLAEPAIVKPSCDAVYKRYFESAEALKAIADIKAKQVSP